MSPRASHAGATMNWSDYRIFVAAADAGSFTAAARLLDLQTSSVSRAISRLEHACRIKLFTRNTRSVALTDSGATLYARLRPLFEQLETAVQDMADDQGNIRGVLRVVAPFEFGLNHLNEVISEMLSTYPLLEIELELSSRRINLLAEGIDVAFGVYQDAPPDSSLVGRCIQTLPVGLFAAPSLVARLGLPQTPQDLRHWPCVSMLHEQQWVFESPDGQRYGIDPRGRFRCSPAGMRIGPVLAGLGATTSPIAFQHALVARGELVRLLPDYRLPPLHVYGFFQGQIVHPKTRLFIDRVVARLAEEHPLPAGAGA